MFDLDTYDEDTKNLTVMSGHNDVERTLLVRFVVLDRDTNNYIADWADMVTEHMPEWLNLSADEWEKFKENNAERVVAHYTKQMFTQH